MENDNRSGSLLRGFLIGGFFGALVGLLLAPKSGRELRSDIRRKNSDALDEGGRVYRDTKAKADAILEDARQRAGELKKEAEHQLSEARKRAEEIMAGAGMARFSFRCSGPGGVRPASFSSSWIR